jgi:hypothetical protein
MEDKLYENYSGALSSIRSSGGWMKFFGILMYILAGMLFLISVFALFGNSTLDKILNNTPVLAGFAMRTAIYFVVLLYTILALFIGLLGYWLHKSGSGAAQIRPTQVENNIVQYASNFRKYLVFTFVVSFISVLFSIINFFNK